MKKFTAIAAAAALCISFGAKAADKEEIVKTGLSYGPLPAVSFDEDKGFQYGALLNLYNYGDGSSYPMYKSKWYFEVSAYTKGSMVFNVMYDKVEIAPGIRFCASVKYITDSAYDFLGFNGYNSNVAKDGAFYFAPYGIANNPAILTEGFSASNLPYFTPFYKIKRNILIARGDLIGEINKNLHWMVGYHFYNFDQGTVNFESLNKGKDPASGIWAKGHVSLAPKWLGSSTSSYRYSLTMRQYFPIIDNNVLTFAYRLNYEGTFGNKAPYYILPYMTVVGVENDVDGIHLATIGTKFPELANGLPMPKPVISEITIDTMRNLVSPAFTIAILGAIESLMAAMVTDGVTGKHHDANSELIGEGIANIVTPLFGGIPATGAIARTMANINNGGRTPVAGMVHAVTLLLIYLFLMPYAVYIPLSALAAILVMVAYNMSEWRTFRYLLKGEKNDVAVLLITFALTVIVDLKVAIEVGVVLAIVLFTRRVMQTSRINVIENAQVRASESAVFHSSIPQV